MKKFGDHRRVLAQNGIDAVIVATPDHWHGGSLIQLPQHAMSQIDADPAHRPYESELGGAEPGNILVRSGHPGLLAG